MHIDCCAKEPLWQAGHLTESLEIMNGQTVTSSIMRPMLFGLLSTGAGYRGRPGWLQDGTKRTYGKNTGRLGTLLKVMVPCACDFTVYYLIL